MLSDAELGRATRKLLKDESITEMRQGFTWDSDEDDLLCREVEAMITFIARCHLRTTGSIKSRIMHVWGITR